MIRLNRLRAPRRVVLRWRGYHVLVFCLLAAVVEIIVRGTLYALLLITLPALAAARRPLEQMVLRWARARAFLRTQLWTGPAFYDLMARLTFANSIVAAACWSAGTFSGQDFGARDHFRFHLEAARQGYWSGEWSSSFADRMLFSDERFTQIYSEWYVLAFFAIPAVTMLTALVLLFFRWAARQAQPAMAPKALATRRAWPERRTFAWGAASVTFGVLFLQTVPRVPVERAAGCYYLRLPHGGPAFDSSEGFRTGLFRLLEAPASDPLIDQRGYQVQPLTDDSPAPANAETRMATYWRPIGFRSFALVHTIGPYHGDAVIKLRIVGGEIRGRYYSGIDILDHELMRYWPVHGRRVSCPDGS